MPPFWTGTKPGAILIINSLDPQVLNQETFSYPQEFCFKADMLLSWLQTQEGKMANAAPISLKKDEVDKVK